MCNPRYRWLLDSALTELGSPAKVSQKVNKPFVQTAFTEIIIIKCNDFSNMNVKEINLILSEESVKITTKCISNFLF